MNIKSGAKWTTMQEKRIEGEDDASWAPKFSAQIIVINTERKSKKFVLVIETIHTITTVIRTCKFSEAS